MAEDYVRPPIVAIEPPDQQTRLWRFRIGFAVLLVVVAVVVFLIAHALIDSGEGNAQAAPAGIATAPPGVAAS